MQYLNLESYIKSVYGTCRTMMSERKCRCMTLKLEQSLCPDFTPVTAKNWDEMIAMVKKNRP
jgi:hypothetical protein